MSATSLAQTYLSTIDDLLRRIEATEAEHVEAAARLLAERIADDRLVHVYGPGGHSNLATQEVFFRAGGLMHVNAILDEGTLLSSGALRSMAVERLPGYGAWSSSGPVSPTVTCWCSSTPSASTAH